MQVVREAEDGRQTLNIGRELILHAVVMDVKMPDLDGIEATRQIHSEFPKVKIIALSMHSDHRFVTNMLKAGACGYLLKDCAFEELAQAIRLAVDNKTYVSPGLSESIARD